MSDRKPPPDEPDDATMITPRPHPGRDRRPRKPPGLPASFEILPPGFEFAERFIIDEVIGKGGMGLVYRGLDALRDGAPVALKMLPGGADELLVGRFRREARLISELAHDNIVSLVAFGEAHGMLYLAMEYCAGEPLSDLLKKEGAMPTRRAVMLALQVARALAVAHAANVVHRDVKPDNIMIVRGDDGSERVKVLDFGVAKITRAAGDMKVQTVQTQVGRIVGSLRYITPEQLDQGEITARTDMYLFGCVFYEMLAGRRVFDYPSPADCAVAHVTETPKPPDVASGRTLPRALVDLVMRCLEKKPAARPADARAAVTLLTTWLDAG